MTAVLVFVAAVVGIVVLAWAVRKITGAHAWYVEDWKFDDGETTVWRDDAADVALITRMGQAKYMTVARLRRQVVIVTDRRIIVGSKPLFGRKRMVQYVLYPSPPADGASTHLDGGLLGVGYQTLVYEPGVVESHADEKKPYLALKPAADQTSSFNLQAIQIYSDSIASFRLP